MTEQRSKTKMGILKTCNQRVLAITVGSLVCLLALIWSATIWDIARTANGVQANVEITTRIMAHALSEHMMSTVKRLELTMEEIDAAWAPDWKKIFEEADGLKKIISDVALQISIIDARGMLIYSSASGITGVNIADREYFNVHLTPPRREIYIGKPVLEHVTGKWAIQFSSPIIRDDTLKGVIIISVEPDFFANFFRSLKLDPEDIIDVVRNDGALLVRSTDIGLVYGRNIKELVYLKDGTPISGNFRRRSQFDGIDRIFGYYKLTKYGLNFVVGNSVNTAFAPYEDIRTATLWGHRWCRHCWWRWPFLHMTACADAKRQKSS